MSQDHFLEQLKLYGNGGDDTEVYLKFSQPTKIKKLNLNFFRFINCSIDSILLNCPHLEEFDLQLFTYNKQPDSVKFLNLSKSYRLKKLTVNYNALSEGLFDSILSNCPNINDLSIILTYEWKEMMKSIYKNCDNLQRLKICSRFEFGIKKSDNLSKELYEEDFFTSSPRCKSTLTHITFSGFKAIDSKADYFKNFKFLKSIRYLNQSKTGINTFDQATEINMDLWLGHILLITDSGHYHDVELRRNLLY
ncbi:hypothetical protein CONCODRAFT_13586 [Conidiobolus coronatus NRRL 28638]|uniref:RNI-like protein n=1 Tax=Conidiobolus coronatus (strain ATCC 28846 / CBS 209.66 / NRRL 28638) TaxID=796925 RepID=A0A137NQF7_CONC2|nr:hypothetical protein CONCODRAFT_13586 [Conidiobolus coronatus NRRL 28638]|eukprot:KXN64989.1 hypothetical protein CONCODRAFT_13586 [Conidiobolus coronatus NRRL 28638]